MRLMRAAMSNVHTGYASPPNLDLVSIVLSLHLKLSVPEAECLGHQGAGQVDREDYNRRPVSLVNPGNKSSLLVIIFLKC